MGEIGEKEQRKSGERDEKEEGDKGERGEKEERNHHRVKYKYVFVELNRPSSM